MLTFIQTPYCYVIPAKAGIQRVMDPRLKISGMTLKNSVIFFDRQVQPFIKLIKIIHSVAQV